MLREHHELIRRTQLFLDAAILLVAWGAAYFFLQGCDAHLEAPHAYMFSWGVFSLGAIMSLGWSGFRPEEHLDNPLKMSWEICRAVFFGFAFFVIVLYVFKLKHLSRAYLLASGAASLALLLAWNLMVMKFYGAIRRRGLNFQHLLLVGNRYTLPPIIQLIKNKPQLGQKVAGVVLAEEDFSGTDEFEGLEVYSGLDKITAVINSRPIDNVLFSIYRQEPQKIEKAILTCQERGIHVWFKPDFMHISLVSHVDSFGGIPLFIFSLGPKYSLSLLVKRLFDFLSALFLLALAALPMLIVAAFVKTTPGPVFFIQKRVGLNGRRFRMAKFRTMHTNAEQRRAEYNLKNEMQGPVFKMKDDPRITPVGRFLRKYSLDELPQFWSVLVGDMSLVGPRPPIPSEVDLYKGWQRRRLSMRPGITCIWQVTGRNKITDFNEWAKLDLKYIDEWSLFLDLKILLKTIPAVIKGTGL